MRFQFLDVVCLARPLETPDGTIPEGTAGTVLDAYPKTDTYMIEFGEPWRVPETVSADMLYQRIADMSDAALASMMEQVNHDAATGGLIDATDWTPEQLKAFLKSRVGYGSGEQTEPITPEQIIQAAIDPPAASLTVTDDTTDEELSAFIRGKRRGQHR